MPESLPPPLPGEAAAPRRRSRFRVPGLMFALGLLVWLWPDDHEAKSRVAPHVGRALLVLAAGAAVLAYRPNYVASVAIGSVLLALILAMLPHSDGWYYSRWERDGCEYVDQVSRDTGRPIHRRMTCGDFLKPDYLAIEGPMAGETKPHGHWTAVSGNLSTPVTHQWYWYGAEISEGEWHLRNK